MQKLLIANWKMNPTSEKAALRLIYDIQKQISGFGSRDSDLQIVLCPPAIYLKAISEAIKKSPLKLGAQNCFFEDSGTYTGEISAKMLADMGVKYCIVGHSERKKYFGETIEDVKKKVAALIKNNIVPVICIGEGYGQPKKLEGVAEQVNEIVSAIPKSKFGKAVFAYEPAWAISGGPASLNRDKKTPAKVLPSPDDILSAKLLVQKCLVQKISKKRLESVSIIYGGSVNAKNISQFAGDGLMDGALVGGASLRVKEFGEIIRKV